MKRSFLQNLSWQDIIFVCLMAFLCASAASANLRESNLWFDESGQFWMAKGLTHFSPPLQKEGSIGDALVANRSFNADPGGFTLLLRLWSKISNLPFWLRLLPFLFLVLASIPLFVVGRKLFPKIKEIPYLFALIPFGAKLLFSYGFEIRAYSMEVAGVALGLAAIYIMREKATFARSILAGCCFAFFLTARYSGVIVLAISALYICVVCIRNDDKISEKLTHLILFSGPIVIVVLLIYFISLRYQLASLKAMAAPTYVWLFAGSGIQKKILFSLPSFVLLAATIYLAYKKDPDARRYSPIAAVAVLANLAFVILSLTHRHPWDPASKYNISLNLLSFVSLFAIVGLVIGKIFGDSPQKLYWRGIFASSFALGCLFLAYWSLSKSLPYIGDLHFAHSLSRTYYELKGIDFAKYRKIYVNKSGSSTLRYLCEYGGLQGKIPGYPGSISIDDKDPTSLSQIKGLKDYDLIIIADTPPFQESEETRLGWRSISDDKVLEKTQTP